MLQLLFTANRATTNMTQKILKYDTETTNMTQKIHKCDTEIASSTKISLCQKFPSLKFKLRKMHTQIRIQKYKHMSEQNIILRIA